MHAQHAQKKKTTRSSSAAARQRENADAAACCAEVAPSRQRSTQHAAQRGRSRSRCRSLGLEDDASPLQTPDATPLHASGRKEGTAADTGRKAAEVENSPKLAEIKVPAAEIEEPEALEAVTPAVDLTVDDPFLDETEVFHADGFAIGTYHYVILRSLAGVVIFLTVSLVFLGQVQLHPTGCNFADVSDDDDYDPDIDGAKVNWAPKPRSRSRSKPPFRNPSTAKNASAKPSSPPVVQTQKQTQCGSRSRSKPPSRHAASITKETNPPAAAAEAAAATAAAAVAAPVLRTRRRVENSNTCDIAKRTRSSLNGADQHREVHIVSEQNLLEDSVPSLAVVRTSHGAVHGVVHNNVHASHASDESPAIDDAAAAAWDMATAAPADTPGTPAAAEAPVGPGRVSASSGKSKGRVSRTWALQARKAASSMQGAASTPVDTVHADAAEVSVEEDPDDPYRRCTLCRYATSDHHMFPYRESLNS